jgi:hypothetical protein
VQQKKYFVTLTADEREYLAGLLSAGKRSALTLTRVRILLKADQADGGPTWEDARIAEALDCGVRTVERVRQRFVERAVEEAWEEPRNDKADEIRWRFTTANARIKLQHLYPTLQ